MIFEHVLVVSLYDSLQFYTTVTYMDQSGNNYPFVELQILL